MLGFRGVYGTWALLHNEGLFHLLAGRNAVGGRSLETFACLLIGTLQCRRRLESLWYVWTAAHLYIMNN